jgi:hypothetical protein
VDGPDLRKDASSRRATIVLAVTQDFVDDPLQAILRRRSTRASLRPARRLDE